jgi:hypothetical protein
MRVIGFHPPRGRVGPASPFAAVRAAEAAGSDGVRPHHIGIGRRESVGTFAEPVPSTTTRS